MRTSSEPGRPLTAVLLTHEATDADDTGIVGPYLASLGHRVLRHDVFPSGANDNPNVDLPILDGVDLVIAFGSTSHAWQDKHAHWVDKEVDWVREALNRHIPTVGICFGGQLLARALGGDVHPSGDSEVGMLQFDTTPDCPVAGGPWFSWHSDFVVLPDEVTVWSTSAMGPQIFTHGTGLGTQFHPEVSPELADAWIRAWPEDLPPSLPPEQFRQDVRQHTETSQAACRALIDWCIKNLSTTKPHRT